MKLLSCGLLCLWANLAGAIDPADPRLRTPTGNSFVRYCSSLLGNKPYQIPLHDSRAKVLRNYYALLNNARLIRAMALYAEDSIYRDETSIYVGKPAIEEQLISSMKNRVGHFQILDISYKNHQLLSLVGFEGTQGGAPVRFEFLEFWVLNRSGKIYHRQTFGFIVN